MKSSRYLQFGGYFVDTALAQTSSLSPPGAPDTPAAPIVSSPTMTGSEPRAGTIVVSRSRERALERNGGPGRKPDATSPVGFARRPRSGVLVRASYRTELLYTARTSTASVAARRHEPNTQRQESTPKPVVREQRRDGCRPSATFWPLATRTKCYNRTSLLLRGSKTSVLVLPKVVATTQ